VKAYQFTLILSGVSELTAKLADIMYQATDGDIECNMRDGVAFLEFQRNAPTLREALISAIRDVEGGQDGVRVARVEYGMDLSEGGNE
jgi:hypothetical protein